MWQRGPPYARLENFGSVILTLGWGLTLGALAHFRKFQRTSTRVEVSTWPVIGSVLRFGFQHEQAIDERRGQRRSLGGNEQMFGAKEQVSEEAKRLRSGKSQGGFFLKPSNYWADEPIDEE